MSGRGKPPKPTETKRRAGNPGCRPLNDSEPEPILGAPPMPSHMEGVASETWDSVCEHLDQMGILAQSDVVILTLYCDTWALYLQAGQQVREEGINCISEKGGKYMNPSLSARSALAKQAATYAAELGLTISSRSRIHATPKKATNEKTKGFNVVGA